MLRAILNNSSGDAALSRFATANTWNAQQIFVSPTTTSPGAVFQANGTISAIPASEANVAVMFQGTEAVQSYTMFSSSAQQINVLFRRRQGTYASPTAIQSGNILGAVQWQGYGVSTFGSGAAAEIRAVAAQNFSESARGTNLEFYTTATGSTTSGLRLTITGTSMAIQVPTSVDTRVSIDQAAGVAKQLRFQTSSSLRWIVQCNSTAETGSNAGSDFRIEAFSDAGASLFNALAIARASGNATFNNLVNCPQLAITSSNPPASATATGGTGMIRWDANYIYVCTATDTWKRVAIATW